MQHARKASFDSVSGSSAWPDIEFMIVGEFRFFLEAQLAALQTTVGSVPFQVALILAAAASGQIPIVWQCRLGIVGSLRKAHDMI